MSVLNEPFQIGLTVCIFVLAVAMCLTALRLILGPTIPDRTVSFDQLSVQVVGIVLLVSILLDNSDIVDIAIVTAVLGFLGTFLLARFLERDVT